MRYTKRTLQDADREIEGLEEKLRVMHSWLKVKHPTILKEWNNSRLFESIWGGGKDESRD